MVLSHRYCCVAIPLYNIGVYALLAEQFVAAMAIGVLNFSAPDIVAVDIPSFGATILGIVCILTALLQAWGFWSVYKEKPANFRLFSRTNFGFVLVCLLLALVWIVLSAAKHNNVVNSCISQFSSDNSSVDGKSICGIFTWIQLGVMGLLWVIFFSAQMYFCAVLRVYGLEQRSDHAKYNSVYSAAGEDMARQSTAWDANVSSDDLEGPSRTRPFMAHGRTDSSMSKTSSLRNEVPVEHGSLAFAHEQQHGQQMSVSSADMYAAAASPQRYQQQQQPQYSDLIDTYGGHDQTFYPPQSQAQHSQSFHSAPSFQSHSQSYEGYPQHHQQSQPQGIQYSRPT